MNTYKLMKNKNNEISCILRIEDNTVIPLSEANTDYQAFLLWKSQGNEPLPADA